METCYPQRCWQNVCVSVFAASAYANALRSDANADTTCANATDRDDVQLRTTAGHERNAVNAARDAASAATFRPVSRRPS